MKRSSKTILGLLLLPSFASPAFAVVRLPAILSDHMVLQRAAEAPVWGWADPGETVTVKIAAKRAPRAPGTTAAGKWMSI